jgi:hypothetical protein
MMLGPDRALRRIEAAEKWLSSSSASAGVD